MHVPKIFFLSRIITALHLLHPLKVAQCFPVVIVTKSTINSNNSQLRIKHQLNQQKQKHDSEKVIETKNEIIWRERYSELCDYLFQNGDCLVPLNYNTAKLGIWVRNQRRSYVLYMKGKVHQSFLTPERIRALDALGFVWDLHEYNWCRRYQQLCEFRILYGHTLVPQGYNMQLASWVLSQRASYKRVLKNENSKPLTKDRIDALNSIGFSWTSVQYTWDVMFKALNEYKQTNGDFVIPSSDITSISLRSWIQKIRSEYTGLQANPRCKCHILTPNRIQSLENIGFPWNGPRTRSRFEKQTATLDDWGTLFDRMRESGIDPNAKPKTHWFEGESRFDAETLQQQQQEKDDFEDLDLDSLWNQEED